MKPAWLVPIATLQLAAGAAQAQTTDPVFLQWEWNPRASGPRVSGLAGAFVTTAQGPTAVLLSPACLTSSPPREASFSVGSLPHVGLVLTPGDQWVFGARVGRSLEMDIAATGVKVTDQTIDAGRVSFNADSLALAAAWRYRWGHHARNGLSLGAGLEVSKLNVAGTYTLYSPASREETRVAYAQGSGENRIRSMGTLGVVYERGHEFSPRRYRLGVVARGLPLWPSNWEPERSSLRLVDGAVVDSTLPDRKHLREPRTLSVGGEAKLWRILLVGQVDHTDYQEVLEALQDNSPENSDQFVFGNTGVDWRAAVEFSLSDVLRIRGGIHAERSGKFHTKNAPSEGGVHEIPSVGASFDREILGQRLRIDADWFKGLSLDRFTLGAALAF